MTFYTDGYEAPVGNAQAFPGDIAPPPWHLSLAYAVWYLLLGTAAIHTGDDMSMEAGGGLGQLVYAVANGVVSCARDVTGSSWRKLLVIEHTDPDGTKRYSRYGHLLAFAPGIAPGVWVRRGQIIGAVGNADGLFYPHLHHDIAKGTLLKTNPTNWPGDNLSAVLANYYDPALVIRENQPMADDTISQVIGLLQQAIAVLQDAQPTPQPIPDPHPEPPPDAVTMIATDNVRVRSQATTSSAQVVVDGLAAWVAKGTEATIKDIGIVANGYHWGQLYSPYQGFVALEFFLKKA